jgi:Tfp pilus assembly protein PilV
MRKGATLVGALVAISILLITFIPLLNLQVGIIKAKYNKQYDNTANLLMSEGLEIVRAIYQSNLNDTTTGAKWNDGLADGNYVVDYKTSIKNGLSSTSTSTCSTTTWNNTCSLIQDANNGYMLGTAGTIFYRYITIQPDSNTPPNRIKVTSTVIVKNLNLSTTKIYSADMELFDINKN